MLKRTVSVILAACALFFCLTPALAEEPCGTIKVRLKSDVAGCAAADVDNFIEILSDNVIFRVRTDSPVSVSDYAGSAYRNELVAGRVYYVHYALQAADGYVLPDELAEGDIQAECDKGVTVINSQIVTANIRQDDGSFYHYKGVQIYAKLVVDGNIFQRIIGVIYDVYLKIRAWSLY